MKLLYLVLLILIRSLMVVARSNATLDLNATMSVRANAIQAMKFTNHLVSVLALSDVMQVTGVSVPAFKTVANVKKESKRLLKSVNTNKLYLVTWTQNVSFVKWSVEGFSSADMFVKRNVEKNAQQSVGCWLKRCCLVDTQHRRSVMLMKRMVLNDVNIHVKKPWHVNISVQALVADVVKDACMHLVVKSVPEYFCVDILAPVIVQRIALNVVKNANMFVSMDHVVTSVLHLAVPALISVSGSALIFSVSKTVVKCVTGPDVLRSVQNHLAVVTPALVSVVNPVQRYAVNASAVMSLKLKSLSSLETNMMKVLDLYRWKIVVMS